MERCSAAPAELVSTGSAAVRGSLLRGHDTSSAAVLPCRAACATQHLQCSVGSAVRPSLATVVPAAVTEAVTVVTVSPEGGGRDGGGRDVPVSVQRGAVQRCAVRCSAVQCSTAAYGHCALCITADTRH